MRGRVTTFADVVWSTMCQKPRIRRLWMLIATSFLAACQSADLAAWPQGEFQPLVGHTRGVTEAAFSADGELLASASEDKTVRLWALETATCSGVLQHDHPVRFVRFLRDDRLVTMSVSTGKRFRDTETYLSIWDLTTQQRVWRHRVTLRRDAPAEVAALASSRGANAFAVLVLPYDGDNNDVVIQVWQGDQPSAVANFEITRWATNAHHRTSPPCFAMQGQRFVFAGKLRGQKKGPADSLTVIDTNTWEVSSHIQLGGAAGEITAASDSPLVAVKVATTPFASRRSLQNTIAHIRVWDIATGQLKAQSPMLLAGKPSMEFVNQDQDLGLRCWRGSNVRMPTVPFSGVGIMSISSGRVLPFARTMGVGAPSLMHKVAFSGDQSLTSSSGGMAAYGNRREGLLHLVNTTDRTTIETLPLSREQQSYVSWIAFAPTNRYLVFAALPSWGEEVPNSELARWKNRFLVFVRIDRFSNSNR